MSHVWRMPEKCADCPFADSEPGLELRKSLKRDRWRSILAALRRGENFHCHKTVTDDDKGGAKVCAGAIEWQAQHGASSNLVRVMQRLDDIEARQLARAAAPSGCATDGGGAAAAGEPGREEVEG